MSRRNKLLKLEKAERRRQRPLGETFSLTPRVSMQEWLHKPAAPVPGLGAVASAVTQPGAFTWKMAGQNLSATIERILAAEAERAKLAAAAPADDGHVLTLGEFTDASQRAATEASLAAFEAALESAEEDSQLTGHLDVSPQQLSRERQA